jgi:ribosome-dependent ATPase
MDRAVVIEGLSHRYGDRLALDNVSLDLPLGRTIGLVGPDGVGKSTVLGIIAGVKRVQTGSVSVLGGDIRDSRFRRALSPRVAYMPQGLGRNLYPTLTVYDNVDFFARLFGQQSRERHARIKRLLDATGLAPFPDRPAGKLSGGMKQKLGLCCSLVHDPDLLILDEPTTGVDPLSRRQFWALVTELRNERPEMTVLVATAYMEEAERFDHLVAMDDGRILECAPTVEVLARSASPTLEQAYVAMLPPAKRGNAEPLIIPPREIRHEPPVIEAEHLTRQFGAFTAVKDVSFRIERGEIFGFLGSNGCGKTTTMKMLTGLLDITEGQATLLGEPVHARDLMSRLKIGYMSQSFSLYEELTVRQNLSLHARLYKLTGTKASEAIESALDHFELREHADARPPQLSLGIRQRLQLAAACLHKPEVLILDEPTSGVDPAARDLFWRHLIDLSRRDRVTIFVSTHFMNEAERCDRISLMHHGRVLAIGAPAELCERQETETLEQAFIDYLIAADEEWSPPSALHDLQTLPNGQAKVAKVRQHETPLGWLLRTWAFARREAMELWHDPIRLAFALIGPIVLLCAATWGITFDVDHIPFAVLDRDQTVDSREFVESFSGSQYFTLNKTLESQAQINTELRSANSWFVLDIPPGFGRDLTGQRQPEVGLYIDGGHLARAESIRAYARGVHLQHSIRYGQSIPGAPSFKLPVTYEPRFTYNQDFQSVYASAPSVLMLSLILIPAMLTALGVVREKELGSITNLYASPATVGEFLLGKQLPYIALTMLSYLSLVFVMIVVFSVPLKGSFVALTLGALCYAFAVTALGLLLSAFVSTQVAALFLTAIVCIVPASNFAGLLMPITTLATEGYWVGLGFPASWFQLVSLGAFTKGLPMDWMSVGPKLAAMLGFGVLYLALARMLVGHQER